MKWRHRTFNVAHNRNGWLLRVDDEPWAHTVVEKVTHGMLAGLGHPCCKRGPLGKWPRGDRVDLFWFKVMNLPNKLYRWNQYVGEIPLTKEQAETLAPEWVQEREAWDDDGDDA